MIKMIKTSEDNYVEHNGEHTMQREYGDSPNGNPLQGKWVLRKAGKWIDFGADRFALANRNDLNLF